MKISTALRAEYHDHSQLLASLKDSIEQQMHANSHIRNQKPQWKF